jgi:imidazolonepropionase-like amidohydrolase
MKSLLTFICTIACLCQLAVASEPEPAQPPPIVIQHLTVIDVAKGSPVADQSIVINAGRITALGRSSDVTVPPGAKVFDAAGKFAIPGLADMHHHLGDGTQAMPNLKKNLGRLLAAGITLVFDPAGPDAKTLADLKATALPDAARYPRFFAAGQIVGAKGGWGGDLIGGLTPATADEAREIVRKQKAAGADAIKFVYDDMSWLRKKPWPTLKPEIVAALIDETHRVALKAYVHAPILKFAKEALRSGADGVVHGIISDPVDDEFIDLMRLNHAVYIGTHVLFEDCADRKAWVRRQADFDQHRLFPLATYESLSSDSSLASWAIYWDNISYTKDHMPILYANLKRISTAGLHVVAGTDTGVPGVLLGVSSQMELLLMVEAGLRPADAIRSATLDAARMLGRERDLGTIEPGKLADIVVLDADPLADIRNIRLIHRIIRGGAIYSPDELR